MEPTYTGEKASLWEKFQMFDINNDGVIDASQIIAISQSLGHVIDHTAAEKIVKSLDINGDGGISFVEFCQWWQYGKDENPLFSQLVKGKFDAYKDSKQLEQKFTQIDLGSKFSSSSNVKNQHTLGIRVGDKPPKSTFSVQLLAGQEQESHRATVGKGFTILDANSPFIVLRGQTTDPEGAKEQFNNILEQIIAMAEGFLPPEISAIVTNSVKFQVVSPESGYVSIGITTDFPFLIDTLSTYVDLFNNFVPADAGASFELEATTPFGSSEILANKNKQFLDLFASYGFNLQVSLNIQQGVVNMVRQLVYEYLDKQLVSSPHSHQVKELKSVLHLFLIESAQIQLNFKNIDDFSNQLFLPGFGIEQIRNQIMASGGGNPGAMIAEIPVATELIDAFKTSFGSEISFSINAPKLSLVYSTSSDEEGGSAELFNLLLGL